MAASHSTQYPRGPRVFPAKLLSSWVAICIYWCLGLFLPGCDTLHFFMELCEVPVGPILHAVEDSLDGTMITWLISNSSQFGVNNKPAESALPHHADL